MISAVLSPAPAPQVLSGLDLPQVYIGYDPRETAAVHVLAESIPARASLPVRIAQVRRSPLEAVFRRPHNPLQSTAFSFSRFLVPWLNGYSGWALFIDADMLCLADIAELSAEGEMVTAQSAKKNTRSRMIMMNRAAARRTSGRVPTTWKAGSSAST